MSDSHSDLIQSHLTRLTSQTLKSLAGPSAPSATSTSARTLLSHFARLSHDACSELPFSTLLNLSICLQVYDLKDWKSRHDGVWKRWTESRDDWETEVWGAWVALVGSIPKEGASDERNKKRVASSIHIFDSFTNLISLLTELSSASPPASISASSSALLPSLASLYSSSSSLPLSACLQLLHITSHLLLPTSSSAAEAYESGSPYSPFIPFPPPSSLLALLPIETPSPPSPFTNLWSDFETLYNASADFMSRPGGEWGEVGLRLIALEGDRGEWEREALKREALEQGSSSSSSGGAAAVLPAALSTKEIEEAISSIQALLPDLSTEFITSALSHPSFQPPSASSLSSSSSSLASRTELILAAALEGPSSIPAPLLPLFLSTYSAPTPSSSAPPSTEGEDPFLAAARARRLATLAPTSSYTPVQTVDPKLNDKVDASTRERIMRLVAIQREEEEEEEREERERAKGKAAAVAAASGGGEDRKPRKATTVNDEEEEEDEEEDRRAGVRGARRGGGGSGEESGGEDGEDDDDNDDGQGRQAALPTTEERLEAALMATPEVFARDSATRKGKGRAALREQTGMSDEQIEGWKIMLDRNPRKLASLVSRNELAPNTNHLVPVAQPSRNRGGSRGGGGGGGAGGGRGGGSEGGSRGGGGRGRANKGSRGHSNAARVRGADRKAGRMGEKA